MDYNEAREFVKENTDRIVATSRSWNNSMYIYSDSVGIWNGKSVDWVHVGIDFFDGYRVEIDTTTEAYKAFEENKRKNAEEYRRSKIKNAALPYKHHGKLTALKIALYLQHTNEDTRSGIHNLMKVKNFRSNFRASLAKQFLDWIRTRPSARKYSNPFSPKQWDCLLSRGYRRPMRYSRGKLHAI